MFAYETVNGNTVLSGSRMTIIAGVFGVMAIICYLLCFNLVRERVEVPANNAKLNIGNLLKSLVTNRSLLGIIAAAIALLLAMLTMQGMAGYVFPNYYKSASAQSMSSLTGTVAMLVICAPLASKLSAKFGKKELSVVSCAGCDRVSGLPDCASAERVCVCWIFYGCVYRTWIFQHRDLGDDHRCH